MTLSDSAAARGLFLAVDQGGHASRAIVLDAEGAVVTSAFAAIETTEPAPGRVEHDPEALVESVRDALDRAVADLGPRAEAIGAAGLATQRSSIVCWDRATGEALSPVISWRDRRGAAWLRNLDVAPGEIHARTGLVLSPHYGASKLRWCLDHLPDVRGALDAGRLACGPLASFVLFRILDERPLLVDPANASRTQLWDLALRDWSPDLLDRFGVPRAALPRCVPNHHPFGHLDVRGRRIPLVVTTGDQAAALFAFGAPGPDTVSVNIGTGAFVQRVAGDRRPEADRLLASVAWQDAQSATYVLEGTVNGAGSALDAVCRETGVDPATARAKAESWLAEVSDPPLFLNGVGGLGSPYWAPEFDSRFVGAGDARAKVVAAIESIAFLIVVNVDEMTRGVSAPRRIAVSGGLSAVDGLCRRLADLTGLTVERCASREATGRGLGFLIAGRPDGWTTGDAESRFEPDRGGPVHERFLRWRREMERALGDA